MGCSTNLQSLYVMLFLFPIKLANHILLHGVKLRVHHKLGKTYYSRGLTGFENDASVLFHMQKNSILWLHKFLKHLGHWRMQSQDFHCLIAQHGELQKISLNLFRRVFYQIHLEFHFIIRLALMVKLACLCTTVCMIQILVFESPVA